MSSKLLAPLIAVAAVMLVASIALGAVLLSDEDETDNGTANDVAVVASPTVAPSSTPAPTAPSGLVIPDALRARFDALPEKLRNETLDQLNNGLLRVQQLEQVIRAFEQRNASIRVGTVVEADANSLRLEVYTTGEDVEVGITADTVITRGTTPIKPADLRKDEMVMVISRDNGATAFGIEALGVQAP
jgi:hypothetical protein